MASRIGLALELSVVRVASRISGKYSCAEFPWDPASPEATADELRAKYGNVSEMSISVGLGFLEVARPNLPPLSVLDARRVLLRDADRYFPISGAVAVSSDEQGVTVFAADSAQLQRWIAAFETVAPVHAIVAAPHAIANLLRAHGVTSGVYSIDAAANEHGLLQLADGHVRDARRAPALTASSEFSEARVISDSTFGAEGKFAAAIGALLSIDVDPQFMLVDELLERKMRTVRQRRAWRSYAFLVVAAALLLTSVNASRNRTLVATQLLADSLQQVSAPAVAARARLARSTQELQTLSKSASHTNDALHVLAAISKALPADAFVQRIEWDGKEWRLEGSTDKAASIVTQLDADPSLQSVRVLNTSVRFRDGNRTRESFLVAFRNHEATNGAH